MSLPWLSVRLTNIVLVNYRVPGSLLLPFVPAGSELDTPDDDPDLHVVSMVALRLMSSRLYRPGVPVPLAQSFPQVNLRFYVRRGSMRAVVFLCELVTSPLVALGGRLLYRQPYHLASLSHEVQAHDATITAHAHVARGGHQGEILVRAENRPGVPDVDSQEYFLSYRPWGFYRTPSGRSFRYHLPHPVWRTYPIEQADVTVDPGAILGREWQVIDWQACLHSVIFAEGSPVTLYLPESLDAPLKMEMKPTDEQLQQP